MNIVKVSETKIIETPHKMDVRRLYDKDTAQAVNIKFLPGERLKPHVTSVDVFFYVLEGTPDILIGDETKTVEADCLIDSPKGIPHCISNNSGKIARVLVVKAPKPNTNTSASNHK